MKPLHGTFVGRHSLEKSIVKILKGDGSELMCVLSLPPERKGWIYSQGSSS